MTRFGFKELNEENWLEPDPLMALMVRADSDGAIAATQGRDLVRMVLEPSLGAAVPKEVQALFEVARSAMAYGFFFYPLYALAGQQIYRVCEAAVAHRCRSTGAPASVRTFQDGIRWLSQLALIPENRRLRWNAVRDLRNMTSHPKSQSIIGPGSAVHQVEVAAELINELFVDA